MKKGATNIFKPIGIVLTLLVMIASIYFLNGLSIQEEIRHLLSFLIVIIFIIFAYYLFTS